MNVKVFDRKDFEKAISTVVGIRTELKDRVGNEIVNQLDFVQKMLNDSMDCIIYNETNIPDGYNVDYEIRDFFMKLHKAVETNIVDSRVIQNLREVSDSPTWLFELLTSYLLAYTKKTQEIGYLESKRKAIVEWLNEIKTFGYQSEAQRKKKSLKTPQK